MKPATSYPLFRFFRLLFAGTNLDLQQVGALQRRQDVQRDLEAVLFPAGYAIAGVIAFLSLRTNFPTPFLILGAGVVGALTLSPP